MLRLRPWSLFGCSVLLSTWGTIGCGDDGADTPNPGGSAGSTSGAAGNAGSGGKAGASGQGGSSGKGAQGGDSGSAGSASAEAGAGGEAGGGEAAGGTGGGDAGEGGTGATGGDGAGHPTSCSEGTCCLSDSTCVTIPDGTAVVVTLADDVPSVGAGLDVIGDAVNVDFGDAGGSVHVTVTTSGTLDPAVVVVVHVAPDGTQTDTPATMDGGEITFTAGDDGIYVVATVDTTPPAGCATNELDGPVEIASNLDADLVDGVTKVDGDLTVSGAVSELAALRCLTHVTGNVTVVAPTALATLPLPALVVAGGGISITGGSELTTVALPELRLLGEADSDSLVLSNLNRVVAVDVRRLVTTPGALRLLALGLAANEPLTVAAPKLSAIRGDFEFEEVNVAHVNHFSALRRIGGALSVDTDASNLSGFASIRSIGGMLDLHGIQNIEDLTLDGVESLGALRVAGGTSLQRISFAALTEVSGAVELSGGSAGTPLALDLGLTHIGGNLDVSLAGDLDTLGAFAELEEIGGWLQLVYSNRLVDVELPALERVGGRLSVSGARLERFAAPVLTSLGGRINIGGAPLLGAVQLPELTALTHSEETTQALGIGGGVYDLAEVDLGSVTQIDGDIQLNTIESPDFVLSLESLRNVSGAIFMESVDATRVGFESLTTVTGSVRIWDAHFPIALEALQTVGGQLHIQGARVGTETLDLSSLTSVGQAHDPNLGLGGSVLLTGLDRTEHVDLGNLSTMPSHLVLEASGEQLAGAFTLNADSLTEVGGDLMINFTHKLQDLSAFANLDVIGGSIRIDDNDALASVDGLLGLTEVGEALAITNNPLLPTCGAEALATHLEGTTFDGTVTISGNLTDACN